jgi:VWFA-related protein
VKLYVSVLDRKGKFVTDLRPEEIRVLEDGKPQVISRFESAAADPLTVGLLIDTSGSQRDSERYMDYAALSQFAHKIASNKGLVFVFAGGEEWEILTDVTDDPAKLDAALERAKRTPAKGSTRLYDAITAVCSDKLERQKGRKALLILSDAMDNASRTDLDHVVDKALRANATIYVLQFSGDSYSGIPTRRASQAAAVMTEATGGLSAKIRWRDDMESALASIEGILQNQFALGYVSSNPSLDGKFRKVKIELTRRGLTVVSRKGYYGPKR